MFREKLNRSIRFKFLVVISVILFGGSFLTSVVIATNESRVLMSSLMNTGQSLASYIAIISRDPMVMKDSVKLDEIVMGAIREGNTDYAVIYDEHGVPVTSQYASINFHLPRINSILLDSPKDAELQYIIDIIKDKESTIEVSRPILMGPAMINIKTIGKVTIGISKHNISYQVFTTIIFMMALNLIFVFILILSLFYVSNRILFDPLDELANASSRLAEGDLSTEVSISTTGEMKMLVDSFNGMVRNLEKVTVSKDYFDNIIMGMINALVVTSSDDIISKVNITACKLLGYEEEELIGRSAETVFSNARSGRDRWMKILLAEGRIGNTEEWWISKTGREVPILLSASVVRENNNLIKGIVYAAQDITDRKHAEEEKKKLEAQLLQSQKMEAIGRLAGGVAHDFNNMLAVILGYAELLKARLPVDPSILKPLTEIEKAAVRSRDITRQLLAFSRKQLISPKPILLNTIVENMQKALTRLIGEDIEFRFIPGKDLRIVKIDPSQVDQILINLVVNSRDAMPDGGRLTIRTSNAVLGEDYCLDHPGSKAGRYALLEVSDDGIGMDRETLSHIFEPFFSTKEPGKGTGLGLATVYGIVKQNGGFIDACSEQGKGTTFKIYLPALDGLEDKKEEPESKTLNQGRGKVLLVEDEEAVREMTTAMLERAGYSVFAAEIPSRALSYLEENKSDVEILITDVVMPEMSGKDLAIKSQALVPAIKVLFISGYPADVIAHRGILEKGVNLIQKPFRTEDLCQRIHEMLDDNHSKSPPGPSL